MHSHPITPFGALIATLEPHTGQGLGIRELGHAGVAQVMAFSGNAAKVIEPLMSQGDHAAARQFLKINQKQWLVIQDQQSASWTQELENALDGNAAVFDQSSAYGVIEIRGKEARKVLQKGIFVDLASALQNQGDCVCSVVAHINIMAWRSGPDSFGLVVPRSFAGSFWHWLTGTAAADGIPLTR